VPGNAGIAVKRTLSATRVIHAFALQETDSIRIVETGKLDIFLAPMENGSPTGALTHVVRVEVGGALFPLPFDRETNFGFLAVPAAETTVQVVPPHELSLAERNELSVPWIGSIARSLSPVPEGLSVERFHAWAAAELIRRRLQTEREESERLNARLRADQKLVGAALQRLSGPFARAGRAEDKPGGTAEMPLAAACLAVGKAAHIELKIPPSVIQGKAKDPLRAITRCSSVRMRMLVLRGDWWTQDSGPMVAFLEAGNAPVALLPRARVGYEWFDPASDSSVRIDRKTAPRLSGIAYVFYRPFPHCSLTGAQVLISGLLGCGRDLWVIALTGLLVSLLALVTPFATGIVFDSIIPGSERGQLLQTVALIVASAVAMIFMSLTRGYALLRVEGKLDFAIQAAVWDRLLNLPTTFFRQYSAGDLTYRSLAISQIRAILTGNVLNAVISGLFSVSSMFLLFYYSPSLSWIAMGLAGAALAVMLAGGLLQLRLQRQITESGGKLAGMIFEFVDGIAKFKVSGTEGRAFSRWAENFGAQKQLGASIRRVGNFLSVFGASFPILSTCVIFFAVASQTGKHEASLSTGGFLAFNVAFVQLLGSVLALGSGFLALLHIVPLYTRVRPIFETLPETDSGKSDPGELSGSIEVNHVAFRYSDDTALILRDVSFSIRPGEFVAFVGASGSGKSTLLRLLLGFERPVSGAIYYDGQDLTGVDIQEVRLQMGIVLQNGKLLPGDILTNIIGSAPMTVDDAWEAVRMAGLEEDIKALPMGMYTMVSEGGKALSGGQRQRLMIARAVVRKPRILIFDEATSALDNRTQEIVSRAMEQMQATRISIAHRLSTVIKADRIFVLDNGRIVQCGTFDELINQEGLFAELARRQLT
jgi:NHLM bacteriocin system ABC transporter ATP-binding protein